MRDPFPHQLRALEYARPRSRIALFMEMRLGKTLTAIRWAADRNGNILVVGPLSVLPGWIDELQKEGQSDIVPLYGLTAARRHAILLTHKPPRVQVRPGEPVRYPYPPSWFLINYEAIRANPTILSGPWSTLILDESTRIRNPKAQITKIMLRQTSRIDHRAILSGLPAPESSLDYFCQMAFLHGSFLGSGNYWGFRNRWFQLLGYDWDPKPGTVETIKRAVHESAFVLTRGEAGIGSKKLYETRVVEMNPEQKQFTREVMREWKFEDKETQWTITKMLWLARLAGGFSPDRDHPRQISDTKLHELRSLATGELADQSVVVWFRFNEELYAAYRVLNAAGVSCFTMTGDTDIADRRWLAQWFKDGKFRVFLVQERIGQFGLDLSRASTAIYFSNLYDYEIRAQSEDRIIHPTKREPLLYIDLITKGSPDRAVVAALKDKSLNAQTFMRRLVSDWAAEWRATHGASQDSRQPYIVTSAAPDSARLRLRARVRRVFPGEAGR